MIDVLLSERIRKTADKLPPDLRGKVALALSKVAGAFGDPHQHRGLGLRKLAGQTQTAQARQPFVPQTVYAVTVCPPSALCVSRSALRPPRRRRIRTKNKKPRTRNKEPRTRNQEQGTKNKAPRTKQQRTNNQEPRTRNKPPPFPKKTPPSLCASRSATPALRPPPPSRAPNRSVS